MHLTLSFLGNVPEDAAEKLKENLAAIDWKAFFLPLVGFGAFPGKGRPKVIWIGVGRGHPLFQLHKRVQEAALALVSSPIFARSIRTSPSRAVATFHPKPFALF